MKNHNLFKLFTIGLLLSVAPLAHAENWTKIYSCENGAAYIDVDRNERKNLQLVFKGEDMLMHMKNAGFIDPRFGDKEYVVRGRHAELRQISPTETKPVSLGGVFYPWDFKGMISFEQIYDPTVLEIEPHGSELSIKLLNSVSGQSCDSGDSDGVCYGHMTNHRTYRFIREYLLRDCHLVQ